MKPLDVINGLDIASPCKASWSAMKGDDRTRLCSHCEKHVYNIAAMTSSEVEDLIRATEGRFCSRLYRRRDGTVLTADCPVGAVAFSSGRLHRALTYGVLGLGFLTTGAFLKAASNPERSWPPTGPGVTFSDWTDWAMRTLGLGGPGPATTGTPAPMAMGEICVTPPAVKVVTPPPVAPPRK